MAFVAPSSTLRVYAYSFGTVVVVEAMDAESPVTGAIQSALATHGENVDAVPWMTPDGDRDPLAAIAEPSSSVFSAIRAHARAPPVYVTSRPTVLSYDILLRSTSRVPTVTAEGPSRWALSTPALSAPDVLRAFAAALAVDAKVKSLESAFEILANGPSVKRGDAPKRAAAGTNLETAAPAPPTPREDDGLADRLFSTRDRIRNLFERLQRWVRFGLRPWRATYESAVLPLEDSMASINVLQWVETELRVRHDLGSSAPRHLKSQVADTVYNGATAQLLVSDRVEALERRIAIVHSHLSVHVDAHHASHGAHLERIIILLIALELGHAVLHSMESSDKEKDNAKEKERRREEDGDKESQKEKKKVKVADEADGIAKNQVDTREAKKTIDVGTSPTVPGARGAEAAVHPTTTAATSDASVQTAPLVATATPFAIADVVADHPPPMTAEGETPGVPLVVDGAQCTIEILDATTAVAAPIEALSGRTATAV